MNRAEKGRRKKNELFGEALSGAGGPDPELVSAIMRCLPYMGFPRTLNALSCINEVLPAAE